MEIISTSKYLFLLYEDATVLPGDYYWHSEKKELKISNEIFTSKTKILVVAHLPLGDAPLKSNLLLLPPINIFGREHLKKAIEFGYDLSKDIRSSIASGSERKLSITKFLDELMDIKIPSSFIPNADEQVLNSKDSVRRFDLTFNVSSTIQGTYTF